MEENWHKFHNYFNFLSKINQFLNLNQVSRSSSSSINGLGSRVRIWHEKPPGTPRGTYIWINLKINLMDSTLGPPKGPPGGPRGFLRVYSDSAPQAASICHIDSPDKNLNIVFFWREVKNLTLVPLFTGGQKSYFLLKIHQIKNFIVCPEKSLGTPRRTPKEA